MKQHIFNGYELKGIFPHDTSSFTEGLLFHDGFYFESCGGYGNSKLRKVDPSSGKVVVETSLKAPHFSEGISLSGNEIVMATYQDKLFYIFDANTLQLIREVASDIPEMWGLSGWQGHLLLSNGTNRIRLLDRDSLHEVDAFEVSIDNEPNLKLNELEVFKNTLYANIWPTDKVAVIDLESKAHSATLDFSELRKIADIYDAGNHMKSMNGLAFDGNNNLLWITGKRWPKIFAVSLVEPF